MTAEKPSKLPPARAARAVDANPDAVHRLLRMLASPYFSLSMQTAGTG